jgi:hypothetical protein
MYLHEAAQSAHNNVRQLQKTKQKGAHIFETKASVSKLGYAEVISVCPAGTVTLKKLSPGERSCST